MCILHNISLTKVQLKDLNHHEPPSPSHPTMSGVVDTIIPNWSNIVPTLNEGEGEGESLPLEFE